MISRTDIRILFAILATFLGSYSAQAQQQTFVGVNITTWFAEFWEPGPAIGLVFERKISNSSAIEANLNLRTFDQQLLFMVNNSYDHVSLNQRYISIPVMYKHYFGIVNAGIGVTNDYFIGWKQTAGLSDITSYRTSEKYLFGLQAKISKTISLSDKFILEPEVKGNLLIPFDRYYVGFGLITTFRL